MKTYYKEINSSIGKLAITTSDHAVLSIIWEAEEDHHTTSNHPLITATEKQLTEYFHKTRHTFDIPLAFHGTPFQNDVWNALLEIPYGTTLSYADIARKIGRPKAVRAVGTAIGKNPLLILIPCHRVIGSNGNLSGFGAGVENKALLLNIEKNSD